MTERESKQAGEMITHFSLIQNNRKSYNKRFKLKKGIKNTLEESHVRAKSHQNGEDREVENVTVSNKKKY